MLIIHSVGRFVQLPDKSYVLVFGLSDLKKEKKKTKQQLRKEKLKDKRKNNFNTLYGYTDL